ncbi:MAG: hypothetical protein KatS3mg105_0539 [Gemmatales bacterium]|nr:MAG: hypothetical protein KatS3mg105_0539 [Gemmatales bacterium]
MQEETTLDFARIAQDLQIRKVQVESVVKLLDEGNTIPFIARYRKERTNGLSEDVLRQIQARVQQLRQLEDRKRSILKSIENQGKLTEELKAEILRADTAKRLEDLYLPYKPKKRTLATVARERGLEPLALAIWNRDEAVAQLEEVFPTLVNAEKELPTVEEVKAGVTHILSEMIAEHASVRSAVRGIAWDTGKLSTSRSEQLAEGKGNEFKDYFQFTESVRSIPPHRILAINRGEKEKALTVRFEFDREAAKNAAAEKLSLGDHPHAAFLQQVLDDAFERLLIPSLEREIRRDLTERAHNHAVSVFARNLRSLLLQPPLSGRRILAIDPGFRTGCKLAALDEYGNVLAHDVMYPHAPQKRAADAKLLMQYLIRKHQLDLIAIGNGTACRETEELVAELIAELTSEDASQVVAAAEAPPIAEVAGVVVSGDAPIAGDTTISSIPDASAVASSGLPSGEDVSAAFVIESAPVGEMVSLDATIAPCAEASVASSAESASATRVEESTADKSTEPAASSTPPLASERTVAQSPAREEPPRITARDLEGLPRAPASLAYIIVNEAGASVYSASPIGREEFPDFDATVRGTISIGRRVLDPLSELVKIDPQNIGVGLYQHDVHPRNLKESLEAVVESSVNHVGVDLNTASVPLLRYVSGLNQLVARQLVEYRKQHGPFRSRQQLLDIPGMGPARFTQAAGFLRIRGGDNPFDQTWIHPESYGVAERLLNDLGYSPKALEDKQQLESLREKLQSISPQEVCRRLEVGEPTLRDIIDALSRPGRDPREDLPLPVFKKGILKLEDLQPGMELKGTVVNVVDFGAFVDIGLKDSGLVHISQLANRFVKNPYDVVAVGDVVTVWVLNVDHERKRVSLTMIKPGTERKPGERRPRGRGDRASRGERAKGDRPPRPPQEQTTEGSQGKAPDERPPRRERRPRPRGPEPKREEPPAPVIPPPPKIQGGKTGTPSLRPKELAAVSRPTSAKGPKPKLTNEALSGKVPLHTFSELIAFFEKKGKLQEEKQEPAEAAEKGDTSQPQPEQNQPIESTEQIAQPATALESGETAELPQLVRPQSAEAEPPAPPAAENSTQSAVDSETAETHPQTDQVQEETSKAD